MAFASNDFRDWVLLAEGGEAEVFRSRQVSLDRPVAIKRLKYAALVNSGAIQRFGGEAKLSASLHHPSLVQVYDYGQEGPYWCIVMEYVDGIDFGKLLHPEGRFQALPLGFKLDLARQLVEVMEFLHGRDVVHRDIKPENVMVDRVGRVKLLDLGLARANPTLITDPHGATLRGTLAYIAPELLRGQAPYGPKSEYYALGLVLLELFNQKRILGGGSANDVLSRIQEGPEDGAFAALPEGLRELIRQCLKPTPAERPDSLGPLIAAIRRELQAVPGDWSSAREILEAYIRVDKRQWLWREVVRARSEGQIESAFGRARELIELNPEDGEAQGALLELSTRLNERHDTKLVTEPDSWSAAQIKKPKVMATVLAVLCVVFAVLLVRGLREAGLVDDLGQGLIERQRAEMKNYPDGLGTDMFGEAQVAGQVSPASRAYGVLVVEGLPRGYSYLVNGAEYRSRKPIQLPEDRYVLEIRDHRRRRVMWDSIAVAPGEPTVFQYEKEGRSSDTHP
jgi:serine/threonine protein kinase